MTARSLAIGLGVLLIGACGGGDDDAGGDGDDGGGAVDAAVAIDAEGAPDATPAAVECGHIQTLYGDLGAVTGDAVLAPQDDKDPTGAQFLSLAIPLNEESPPDVLFVELWEEYTPYEAGLAAGSVTIIEDQADVFQCGACVYIAGDFVAGDAVNFYMARSGSVVIDEVDATPGTGTLRGSLSNVTVQQINIVPGVGQEIVEGGCVADIDAVAFDVGITVPAMATASAETPSRARTRLRARAPR